MARRHSRFVATFAAIGVFACLPVLIARSAAQNPAVNAPDMVAWQLFLDVNRAASSDGNNNALFETWARDGDLFRPNPQWPSPQGERSAPSAPRAILQTHLQLESDQERGVLPKMLVVPPPRPGDVVTEETRRNRAAFDFIVRNKLYLRSGVARAFGSTITFPIDAVEVKANWVPVTALSQFGYRGKPSDAGLYYHVNKASNGVTYALIAMHVISKLVPNWTWATFEQENNPRRCDVLGCYDSFGAQRASVPPNPQDGQGYGACAKTEQLQTLFAKEKIDPAFRHYCLKGTQVDFTDAQGLANRLGNSITEDGFVQQSSCMTCHSRAAFDNSGAATTLAGFDAQGNASVGPIQQSWFWSVGPANTGPLRRWRNSPDAYWQTAVAQQIATSADFVWSIPFCAYDDTSNPPKAHCQSK